MLCRIFVLTMSVFCNCSVPLGFLPWQIRIAFPEESQLRQSHATQNTVYAGCFSVTITHRTLTRTTGSLTDAQMLMHAILHGGARTHVKECGVKVDSGRKILCRTGESNLPQRRAGRTLYRLSYIPAQISGLCKFGICMCDDRGQTKTVNFSRTCCQSVSFLKFLFTQYSDISSHEKYTAI